MGNPVDPRRAALLAQDDPEAFQALSPAEQVAAARLEREKAERAPAAIFNAVTAPPPPQKRQSFETLFAQKVREAAAAEAEKAQLPSTAFADSPEYQETLDKVKEKYRDGGLSPKLLKKAQEYKRRQATPENILSLSRFDKQQVSSGYPVFPSRPQGWYPVPAELLKKDPRVAKLRERGYEATGIDPDKLTDKQERMVRNMLIKQYGLEGFKRLLRTSGFEDYDYGE